jgi:hypothetical protein
MKSNGLTLGLDVDSTVWGPGAWVCEAVLELTRETLDLESVTTLTYLFDSYEEKVALEVFERVFSPERISEREPYPRSARVLRRLQEERGVGVHFVTRTGHDPKTIEPRLEPWIREHFGREVGLTVTTGDKLPILLELGAFGLIDDHPDTIGRVADAGLWAAAKIQPWNRALLAERSDVHGFSDWREVPDLLPPLPEPTTNK